VDGEQRVVVGAWSGVDTSDTWPELAIVRAAAHPAAPGSTEVTRYERSVKRAVDLVGAVVLLIALVPLLILVAIAVRVAIGPGVVFKQARVGRGEEPFTLYKFRTMFAERRRPGDRWQGEERRRSHKSADDPRVCSLGRFLRKFSLDELPQVWNVIRGEMSLVGPRPELVDIVARYQPWQHERHRVRPGLTGLWQVSARGDGRLMHEHTALDLEYAARMTFHEDCRILLLTVPAVLGRRKGC
jgi:lipopolysaccharide/colanic/teichoic acid biosynthesis glycosyltransferase